VAAICISEMDVALPPVDTGFRNFFVVIDLEKYCIHFSLKLFLLKPETTRQSHRICDCISVLGQYVMNHCREVYSIC
jgi:hypothetical protein